jgi:hypothetical protein
MVISFKIIKKSKLLFQNMKFYKKTENVNNKL